MACVWLMAVKGLVGNGLHLSMRRTDGLIVLSLHLPFKLNQFLRVDKTLSKWIKDFEMFKRGSE